MEVIYDIITENELRLFEDRDWELLRSLLDDTLAVLVRDYMNKDDCDPEVKKKCQEFLGDTVASYTFHLDVIAMNITTLVREVQPETILLNTREYLDEIKEKFTFLKNNSNHLRTVIPARKRQDWEEFYSAMESRPFSTAAFITKLRVNKSIFCSAREVDRVLPTKYIITVKNKWEMALNAILYDEECRRTGNNQYDLTGRLRFF